jgi:hypothetical protein
MTAPTEKTASDRPLFWLVVLDASVERGDFVTAAEAQRQLERLGVSVRYRGRRGSKPAAVCNA